MATVCIHDKTKMVANPYASRTDQFYCPKCGSGDEAAMYQCRSANGRKPSTPPALYATEYTCPECGGQCEREEWRCSWLCPNCMIMFNDPDPAPPADCTCIDLPDGRQRTCPACRDRAIEAAGGAIPF